MSIKAAIMVILYVLLAPLAGGLMEGLDRKISARMQGIDMQDLQGPVF